MSNILDQIKEIEARAISAVRANNPIAYREARNELGEIERDWMFISPAFGAACNAGTNIETAIIQHARAEKERLTKKFGFAWVS